MKIKNFNKFVLESLTEAKKWKEFIDIAYAVDGLGYYGLDIEGNKNKFSYDDIDGNRIEVTVKGGKASIKDGQQNMSIEDFLNLMTGGDPEILESVVNENDEYVQAINIYALGNALGEIGELWKEWKNGPLTEPKDIKPAEKQLKQWITNWMKDNIK